MSPTKRGPYWADEVVQTVRDLLVAGWRPTGIHDELQEHFQVNQVPPLSTVQRWCRGWRFNDDSGRWRPYTDPPQNATVLLRTLKDLVVDSEGRIDRLSNQEARTIFWLRSIHPDLSSLSSWYLSRYYLTRKAHSEPTDDLDLFIAFSPWKGESEWADYEQMIGSTELAGAPATLTGIAQLQATGNTDVPTVRNVEKYGGFEWMIKFAPRPAHSTEEVTRPHDDE